MRIKEKGPSRNGTDNEYTQSPISRAEYFAELEAVYRSSSIVVPLTYNDPGEDGNFINGTVSARRQDHWSTSSDMLRLGSRRPLWVTDEYASAILK